MSDVQDEVNVQVEKFISEHQKIEELERRNQELMNQFGSMTANLITLIITFEILFITFVRIYSKKCFISNGKV